MCVCVSVYEGEEEGEERVRGERRVMGVAGLGWSLSLANSNTHEQYLLSYNTTTTPTTPARFNGVAP